MQNTEGYVTFTQQQLIGRLNLAVISVLFSHSTKNYSHLYTCVKFPALFYSYELQLLYGALDGEYLFALC